MRDDFSSLFEFEWLRDSAIEGRDGSVRRESWSLMMRRKAESQVRRYLFCLGLLASKGSFFLWLPCRLA